MHYLVVCLDRLHWLRFVLEIFDGLESSNRLITVGVVNTEVEIAGSFAVFLVVADVEFGHDFIDFVAFDDV
jgi:hypothetical protein